LAGFRFEVQPPPLVEKLPRMDIAVFVGFAAAGPMHAPVLIEDVARFGQIFGADLPLAVDPVSGQTRYAHLGPAVRHFFVNGGKRCWVIRVAGDAETVYFPLPGLLEKTGTHLRPAFARARSAGSWFDRFACATALAAQIIPVGGMPEGGEVVARLRTGSELSPGDLLRFRMPDQDLEAYGQALALKPGTPSPPETGAQVFIVRVSELQWFEKADYESIDRIPCEVVWRRSPNLEAATNTYVGLLIGGLASPPQPIQSEQLVIEIDDDSSPPGDLLAPPPGTWLELHVAGDTLWFMVDEAQAVSNQDASPSQRFARILGRGYWVIEGSPPTPANVRVIAEKLTFEIQARSGETEAMRLLDLGFAWPHARAWSALPEDAALFPLDDLPTAELDRSDANHEDLRQEAQESPSGGNRFPLAGTGNPEALYLPLLMPALPQPFLPAEQGASDPLTRDGLAAFSADLFLDPDLVGSSVETLLADADFIRYEQRRSRPLRGIHAALGVEEATLIAVPDAVHSGWDLVQAPTVPDPQPSLPLPHPGWGLSEKCGYEPNPSTGEEPRYDKFLDCALRKLTPPKLELLRPPDDLGTFTLQWRSPDAGVDFILEESGRSDFNGALAIFQGSHRQLSFPGKPAGSCFYRVRAVADEESSNWSDGIAVTIPARFRYGMRGGEFDLAPLLDIHRSLLRLAAARGDLFAVLSLPEHFQSDESRNYVRLLRAPDVSAAPFRSGLPLGRGERAALSFGAVYHPWLITREADELLTTPPDGAATGVMARRALERGAWIAPANELFRSVIALTPRLGEGRRLDLLMDQLNQISQEPSGFMVLNQDTLSVERELRPINVRRLLILLRRAALRLGATYVFEPNGPALRRLVQHAFESLLDQLFVRGAFAGTTRATSFEVVTDDTINTPQSLALARFRVDLKVAPSEPLSFVTVRLVQIGESGVATEIL
jgi:hypothetical protein